MIIFGASHSATLMHAAKRKQCPVSFFHMKESTTLAPDGTISFSADFLRAAANPEASIISMIAGNTHNHIGMVKHRIPFDFIEPGSKQAIPTDGAVLLPYSAIEALTRHMAGRWLATLALLGHTFPGRVVHLESPPQIEDNEYIAKQYAPILRKRGYTDFTIAPPERRQRLWRLHSRVFRQTCRENGVRFLPCPRASMDENGFLDRYYWRNATHANGKYGSLLLRQIRKAGL